MRCRFYIPYILIGLLLFTFVGCKMINRSSSDKFIVDYYHYNDSETISINNNNGSKLTIVIDAGMDIPDVDLTDERYAALYNAFCCFVFDADSMPSLYTPKEMPGEVVKYLKNRYVGSFESEYIETDSINQYADITSVEIGWSSSVLYNDHGIISFGKATKTVFENREPVSVFDGYYYFNYDIAHGKVIDNLSLFGEENLDVIVSLIRQQLLRDNGARNEQQLIDLGFFNLDNIFLTNNFTFNKNGIMWEYHPLELGCFDLGNVEVELSYSDLAPYVVSDEINLSEF